MRLRPHLALAALFVMAAVMIIMTSDRSDAREASWAHFDSTTEVCVENHAGKAADLARAVHRWNAVGARLRVQADCGTWAEHRFIVRVEPYRKVSRTIGRYDTLSHWTRHQAAEGRILLNRYQPPGRKACMRSWVITHELGHALGLAHTTQHSVMNYADWKECGRLTRNDRPVG